MKKIERLTKVFDLELPDRPPILGGWLAAPEHIQTLTGCSEDEYWADPFHSNTIILDTPLENIQTYWQTVLESTW